MKNFPDSAVDYAVVLADLKAKRGELDKAIQAIESLKKLGMFNAMVSQQLPLDLSYTASKLPQLPHVGKYADLPIYEAAVALLDEVKKRMSTKEIVSGLEERGRVYEGKNPYASVAATLYKSVEPKAKKGGKLVALGNGLWGLSNWSES